MTTGDSADNRECKKEIIETHSAEETFALGQRIGREALPGQVYTLIGDLGVGKTVFTHGAGEQPDLYHCADLRGRTYALLPF